jgi:O-antigen ligase
MDRRMRWAIMAALALTAVGSIASGQRILWPLFVIQAGTGAVLLHRHGKLAWSRRAGFAAGAGTIAVAAILFIGVQQWREQSETARPVAGDVRLSVWPKAAVRIIEHPLIGAGLGRQAMRKAYPELVPDEDTQVWHAHNMFLNAGISMGLPGIAALVFVFGAFFAAYLRLAGKAQRPVVQLIGIAGVLMLVGILGRNLTNDFFVRDGALLFWALNGALLGAGTRLRCSSSAAGTAGR